MNENVEETFGFAEMQVVSFEDLFGGKLHAAVDRQHPRDLFDVKLLYQNEGLTDALFRTFLIYVASSGRPPHELVRPSLVELDEAFVKEFEGLDGFVGCFELQGLELLGEVVCDQPVADVSSQLLDRSVVEGFDRRFLDGSDHPLGLAVIRYVICGAYSSCCFFVWNGLMVSPSGTWGTGSTKVRAGRL